MNNYNPCRRSFVKLVILTVLALLFPSAEAVLSAQAIMKGNAETVKADPDEYKKYFDENNYRYWAMSDNTYVITSKNGTLFIYLLLGQGKALLVDTGYGPETGYGYGPELKGIVNSITGNRYELSVFNTHQHGDHTGGDVLFPGATVYVSKPTADSLTKNNSVKPAYSLNIVKEGDIIDLGGGRTLKTLEIPCHATGSLALIDSKYKLAFTGDEFESAQVMMDSFAGTYEELIPVLNKYKANMKKLEDAIDDGYFIMPAHNGAPISTDYIDDYIALCDDLIRGEAYVAPSISHPIAEAFNGDKILRVEHGLASFIVKTGVLSNIKNLASRPGKGYSGTMFTPDNYATPFEKYFEQDAYRFWKMSDSEYIITSKNGTQYMYLITGDSRSLLIDSGWGVGVRIKDVVERLTGYPGKPVEIAITHEHFDHVSGNWDGATVYMTREAKEALTKEGQKKYTINVVKDGDIIDLGNRPIEIIKIPSHAPGSMALLDRKGRKIYTGDELDTTQVMMFSANDPLEILTPRLQAHKANMQKLLDRIKEFDYIMPGHNGAPASPQYIRDFMELADDITLRREVYFAPGLNHSIIEAQPFSAGLKRAEHGLASFFIWNVNGIKVLKEKPGNNASR
jgi:hydroxyacylglutathione hydrolase